VLVEGLTFGPDQPKLVAAGLHNVVSVTVPPPTGSCGGFALNVQTGTVNDETVTVADAAGAAPAPFDAITVKVEVAVTLTFWLAPVVVGATFGPVHV